MKRDKLRLITMTGVIAALITVFTAWFVHVPTGINGGYIHFGDAIIYMAAVLLPTPYAMAAGAIGGGLADLLTAPAWTLATVIIKMLIVLPFTSKKSKMICARNMIAPVLAFVISCVGYYLAEAILFGTEVAFIASATGSLAQSLGSAIMFYVIAVSFDKANVKKMLLGQLQRQV